ncbi:hypothetical protein SAMN02745857_03784 [Andreprevotia lacus DSM 23236]|uniref:DUF2239 domain-containing protein n=1 Tax=Andreprevotia lacus DSM 23236 TaxID=1121001 RepID=A0A1W1Y0S3_9NEIS|nr:DUF2239 family protein [Andreprevotia lacus]SMC29358.1 hypothetical protein SAMN02745857_03784 [Andreprevotia lacus DSM 23236]
MFTPINCTAFAGTRRIASGTQVIVAAAVKQALDAGENASILVFDDSSSQPVEFDLRGTVADVAARYAQTASEPVETTAEDEAGDAPRGRGRPKLGVVAREITLLPRHWDWLASQPGGASVVLRKLVEAARKAGEDADRKRLSQEATYRFMSAMGGNLAGFEDATRALFAGDGKAFDAATANWPADVRDYARQLAIVALW